MTIFAGNAPLVDPTIDDPDNPNKIVTYGGIAQIKDRWSLMRLGHKDWNANDYLWSNIRVTLHELGHNLGLYHASSLFTNEPDGVEGAEYGDNFDRMGSGGGEFNARFKQWLRWLPQASVPRMTAPGVFTIRPMDEPQSSGVRSLQIDLGPVDSTFDSWINWKSLYIDYRPATLVPQSVPYLPYEDTIRAYGAQLRLSSVLSPKTWLLDARPETPNWQDAESTFDSPLMVGRTFAYTVNDRTAYITNLGADPASGELTVEVQMGPIPDNDPPVGKIQASTYRAAVGR
jgi:hypothetical protein